MFVSEGSLVIRSFIAIAVSNSVLEPCQRISRHLRELQVDGRFLRSESIHLTLNFLGNIEPEVVSEVVEILKPAACETASFDLQVQGVGVSPHLTLVRIKSRKNLSKLVRYVQTIGLNERAGQIRARDIHLYQSILKPQGAEYCKLQTAELS